MRMEKFLGFADLLSNKISFYYVMILMIGIICEIPCCVLLSTSNLVLLESMSFNMYGNLTVTKLIDRIPEDGKGVINLSLVFLTEQFPPDVASDIWEFT